MKRPIVRAGLVVLTAVAVASCASADKKPAMTADEAIAKRQQLMKDQGAAMRRISDNIKAGQTQAVAADAEILAKTAKQIGPLFPKGSVNPNTSRAKPEIWQKWDEFDGYSKSLETKANQLAAHSKKGDAQATAAAAGDLGKTTCGACHTAFRGPEIKK
jgi:cytochrome c556